jgi:hypothetical protein
MSRETVEAMRHAIEVWNQDDFDAYLEVVGRIAHPDLEWFAVIAQLVEGQESVYRGLPGMRRFWEDWHEVFDFRFDKTDIRDLGGTLLILSHVSVTGRTSGVGLDTPLAMVAKFEDGRLIRLDSYLDHTEALEAVGLSE